MRNLKIQADWVAAAGLTLASMLWGTSFVVLKAAMGTYNPYTLILGRMAVATLFFAPILIKRRRSWRYPPGSWKILLFMGLCEPCLYFIMEVEALRRTTASQAGMITAMLPLMVSWGAYIFLKERSSVRMAAGFALAVSGACWLSLSGCATAAAPAPLLGNFLEFLAMVCSTGYFLSARHLIVRFGYSPFLITAVQGIMGLLFNLPVLFLPGISPGQYVEPEYLAAVVYLGGVISIGAYGLYNYGVARISVGQAAAFVNLIPVSSVFWGWLLLGERFNAQQYAASLMILAGITLSQGKSRGR